MKVGILGSGDVARAIASGFLRSNDEVMLGTRDPESGKLDAWRAEAGAGAQVGTFAEAAAFGERVVLAVFGQAVGDVLQAAGRDHLTGKVLIDATNPLDFSQGAMPRLIVPEEGSGGEHVQANAPDAKVVKCWNTTPHIYMADPKAMPGGPPTMFICGDHQDANDAVRELLESWGWDVSDLGPLHMSRHLEAMCIVWVAHGAKTGTWSHAFKVLSP